MSKHLVEELALIGDGVGKYFCFATSEQSLGSVIEMVQPPPESPTVPNV
jgi:hypothetical protein